MELHCSEKAHDHLQSSVQKRKELQVDHMEEPDALTSTTGNLPKTLIFGFSKGGVVLNQLLAELAHVELHGVADMEDSQTSTKSMAQLQGRGMVQHKLQEIWIKLAEKLRTKSVKQTETVGDDIFIQKHQASRDGNQVFPVTVDEFLKSIAEIHYVDVGLNCSGAYQTDACVLENVVKAAMSSSSGLHLSFHGTPRQWNDKNRYWISSEKDRCITLLQDAAHRLGSDKVRITEKLYFGEERPSLQMHFKILESLVLN